MRKLYDCFNMFNELDILEIRLNELYNIVDYFVIHESTKSFTGNPKSLYFKENEKRFEKFKDKIIYKYIDDTPESFIHLNVNEAKDEYQKIIFERINKADFWDKRFFPYGREAYEKESIIYSLTDLDDDDIVMFSDIDEIPKGDFVEYLKQTSELDTIYNFGLNNFWFYINCLKEGIWGGNILLSFGKFKNTGVIEPRNIRIGEAYANAGWHFSFMGGSDEVNLKIKSFSHQDINAPYVLEHMDEFIEECIIKGHDFYMHPCQFSIIPVNYDNHPKYLVDNQEKFSKYIRSIA